MRCLGKPYLASVFKACIAGSALLVALGASTQEPINLNWSQAERRAILAHGPWPMPWRADPSNRVSGNSEAAALGQRLFFDGRLSANGKIACVTCHHPPQLFTDARAVSQGIAKTDRNAPSLINIRYHRWFGMDGGSDSLWSHALRPLMDVREHGITLEQFATHIARDTDLACRYRKVFGREPSTANATAIDQTSADAAKALAAFQETLVSPPTPFDTFRDALARNDLSAAPYPAPFPMTAQRGLRTFIGKGQCTLCHTGPLFSNREFGDIGIPFFIAPGKVDKGRHSGIERVLQDRFNLLGTHNDDASKTTATPTRHVALQPKNFGEWKVPSLRNVARTAPYMHNGSIATLREVVRHYSEINEDRLHADGEKILKPLKLTEAEIDDLVAFLASLSVPGPALMVELLPTALARRTCVP